MKDDEDEKANSERGIQAKVGRFRILSSTGLGGDR